MAYKFEIKSNAVVVTDTITGEVLIAQPSKNTWFEETKLDIGSVSLYGMSGTDQDNIRRYKYDNKRGFPVNECQDQDGATFSTTSFRDWCYDNLAFSSAGRSSALKTAAYLIGWQDFADTTTQSTPIAQTLVNGGEVQLTNNNGDTLTDGNTSVNAETTAKGVNDLWSTQSNTFVFGNTGLDKNDLLSLRIHLKISANIISQDFSLRFDFYDQIDGLGTKQFSLTQQASTETLGAGVFRERILTVDAFVGESILNGSAKLFLVGTKSFEVEVVGWNIRIFKIAR